MSGGAGVEGGLTTARVLGRGWAGVLALLLLVGHGHASPRMAAPVAGWQVVLAAGDDAEPVFDNATRAMAAELVAAGIPARNIRRLSASPAELRRGGIEPATVDALLRRIAEMPAGPDDRCFVFLTSHGERGAGLWLARSGRALRPAELAQALSQGCAAVPTVVIASGCYTGGFAGGAMARPNRVILTAARADRPSFGCQAQRNLTFFDECLLRALPRSASLPAVFLGTKVCVGHLEHALGELPSDPQAYFGVAAATLRIGY